MIPVPPLIPSSQNFGSTVINQNLDIYGKITFQTGSCVGHLISGSPSSDYDAVNKQYVDNNSGGSPAGSNGSIQFNDNGLFGGSSLLTWTSDNNLVVNGIRFSGSNIINVNTSTFILKTLETTSDDTVGVTINSGNTTSGTSGTVNLKSGDSTNFITGDVNIKTGNSSTAITGHVNINTGNCDGDSGSINIKSGNSVSETSGSINIESGSGSSRAGSVNIMTGQNLSGRYGTINLTGFLRYFNKGYITIYNENITDPGFTSRIIYLSGLSINPQDYYEETISNSYVQNISDSKSNILLSIVSNSSSDGIPVLSISQLVHETSFTYRIYNAHTSNSISGNIAVGYIIINTLTDGE